MALLFILYLYISINYMIIYNKVLSNDVAVVDDDAVVVAIDAPPTVAYNIMEFAIIDMIVTAVKQLHSPASFVAAVISSRTVLIIEEEEENKIRERKQRDKRIKAVLVV